MGESSLLLAEASVGKNAERDSHELGAREPSISTAAACVGCRSVDSPHTVLRAPQYSNDSPVITQRKATGGTVRHLFYVWLNVNFWKHFQSVSTCFFLFFFYFPSLPKRIYFFTLLLRFQQCQLTLWKSRRHLLSPVPLQMDHTHRTNLKMPASIEK